MPLPIVRSLAVCLSLTMLLVLPATAGEILTITAKDGRSIEAEILSYKGDIVKIRRTDTGKEHRLSIASLGEEEQKRLRSVLDAHPELKEAIRADAVRVEFSRLRKTSPEIEAPGQTTTIEQISFSIKVTNRSNEPLKNLRADYAIFVDQDPDRRNSAEAGGPREPLTQVTGSKNLSLDPSRGDSFVTQTVTCTKTKLLKSWTVLNSNGETVRYIRSSEEAGTWRDREIKGIGIRIFDGDTLVHQMVSPETLASEYAAEPSAARATVP